MTNNFSDERRCCLKSLVLFGGILTFAPLAKEAGAAAGGKPLLLPEKTGQGYRETEHIVKYYKAAAAI